MNKCVCGCGAIVKRRFVSGHNLSGVAKSDLHKQRISDGQRKAWLTKRRRMPIGSTYTDACGYVLVKVTVGKGIWKRQHAIVMESVIGRPLKTGEVIHHIDGNRKNNAIENLFLCRDRSHHNEVHRSQDEALRSLLANGAVRFLEGRYEAVLPR